jgi:agmatinase
VALVESTPAAKEYAARVRERVGGAAAFLSYDVDVVEPAFARATAPLRPAGLSSHEVLGFARAPARMRLRGFDAVEGAPPHDSPGQGTPPRAANLAHELLPLGTLAGEG